MTQKKIITLIATSNKVTMKFTGSKSKESKESIRLTLTERPSFCKNNTIWIPKSVLKDPSILTKLNVTYVAPKWFAQKLYVKYCLADKLTSVKILPLQSLRAGHKSDNTLPSKAR